MNMKKLMMMMKKTKNTKSSRLRKCDLCDKHRLLDKMAREKHKAGYFPYKGQNVRIQFKCHMLDKTECSDDDDVNKDIEDIDGDSIYVIANNNVANFSPLEYKVMVCRLTLVEGNSNVYLIKELANIGFTNEYDRDKCGYVLVKIRNGVATAPRGNIGGRNRFIPAKDKHLADCPLWKIMRANAREAKCVIPWLDQVNPNEDQFCFSAERLENIHNANVYMGMMKILECTKCKRTSVGLEDKNAARLISSKINETITGSEVLNSNTSIEIDYERFKESDTHETTGTSCRSICTECSPKYDDNGDPLFNVNTNVVLTANSQDNQGQYTRNEDNETDNDMDVNGDDLCSSSESGSNKMEASGESSGSESPSEDSAASDHTEDEVDENNNETADINVWGKENLMSLNTFDDQEYYAFARTLTLVEMLVCTPLHIHMYVMRSHATGIPFTKDGSICYPLRRPFLVEQLPLFNLKSLPMVVVAFETVGGTVKELTVDMRKIERVKYYQQKRVICPVTKAGRPQYRLADKYTFTDAAMEALSKELEKMRLGDEKDIHVTSIPVITDERLSAREEREVSFAEFDKWFSSGYEYACIVSDFTNMNKGKEDDASQWLWEQVREHAYVDSEILTISINMVLDYATFHKWIVMKPESTYKESLNTLVLEFEYLSTEGSNDEGISIIPRGSATIEVGENPDLILQEGVRGTILQNRIAYSGVNRDAPHADFDPDIWQLAAPFVFLR